MCLVAEATLLEREERGQSLWLQSWRRLRRKRVAMLSLAFLVIVYLGGAFAPWLAPHGYNEQNLEVVFHSPSWRYPLGTDRLGRDMLSRLIWGARTAAIVSIAAVATGSLFLGIFLGSVAGYMGRWVDTIIMRVGDIFLAFPSLLLVIIIAATVKPRVTEFLTRVETRAGISGLVESGAVDYLVVFGTLALVGWVGMARLVRGQILSIKERPFVEAAQALGASSWRILFVHILPSAISPVIVTISMAMGSAVTSEVVLSWLGIGIQPPNPSWGRMIFENGGVVTLRIHPHLLIEPVMVVALVIFAFNLLGDGLNDALNPRVR
ncbi:MAG: ABC transporter permease [Chloroflexi bacterium]|nr:ABC transporter permease [Chloroflexota bacterium]